MSLSGTVAFTSPKSRNVTTRPRLGPNTRTATMMFCRSRTKRLIGQENSVMWRAVRTSWRPKNAWCLLPAARVACESCGAVTDRTKFGKFKVERGIPVPLFSSVGSELEAQHSRLRTRGSTLEAQHSSRRTQSLERVTSTKTSRNNPGIGANGLWTRTVNCFTGA
jgi:hypothetical protein